MASVTLAGVRLHLATDPATFIQISQASEVETPVVRGEVRTYANGRRRAIRRPGTARSLAFRFSEVDRQTVDQLREWIGTELMLRDQRGRVLWGVYWQAPIEEWSFADLATVTVTFEQISHDEAV